MKPTSGRPQCHGKNMYSHAEAQRTKAIVGKVRDKDLRVYECPDCHKWHLTKNKNNRGYGTYE